MSNIEIGLWSFPVLLFLIFIRIPIGLAMMAVGFGGTWMVFGSTLMTMGQLKHLTYSCHLLLRTAKFTMYFAL